MHREPTTFLAEIAETPLKSNTDTAFLNCRDDVKCLDMKRTGVRTTSYDRDLDCNALVAEASVEFAVELKNAVASFEADALRTVQPVFGRFTCGGCGEGYHKDFKRRITSDRCEICGSTNVTRRADDNPMAEMSLRDVYATETAPLVSYYDARRSLHRIDCMTNAVIEHQIAEVVHTA